MSNSFLNRIRVSNSVSGRKFNIQPTVIKAYQIASEYLHKKYKTKLCFVLPAKEFTSQWLTLLLTLDSIKSDFQMYENEIFDAYKSFEKDQLLILNNDAIVKWVGYTDEFIKFSTKPEKNASAPIRFAKHKDVIKLQPAPSNRTAISTYKKVMESLNKKDENPIDEILNIYTAGNKQFIKKNLCLIDKFKDYDQIFKNVYINAIPVENCVQAEKISEEGFIENLSPLLLSNNFERLLHYSATNNTISKIVIDGFDPILESISNYQDFEAKGIPTILVTDLGEIDKFNEINNLGFEFFNFTKEQIDVNEISIDSPFYNFETKLSKYQSFRFNRIQCEDELLTKVSQLIHQLPSDDSNSDLTLLKVSLIKAINTLSRICHRPSEDEINDYHQRISSIYSHFKKCHLWLGEANIIITEIIPLLFEFIDRLNKYDTDKRKKLESILSGNYDYVICTTDAEVNYLKLFFSYRSTKVISVGEVNDNLQTDKPLKAILTGWPRANNFNRLLVSFLFDEITALLYSFENIYYNSIQKRNSQHFEKLNILTNAQGFPHSETGDIRYAFEDLFLSDQLIQQPEEREVDIYDFELKIENSQYSKYILKGNASESVKAQRVDFGNNTFVYATESHKFLVINDLLYSMNTNPVIHHRKIENLRIGDIIALINTDRDILVDMVRNSANSVDYGKVNKWIEMWKELLEKKYASLDYDFRALVNTMRSYGCNRHEATIRTWLNDENMIGPEDDSDLKVIAYMSNSELLQQNIHEARNAINIMTSWRMRAADMIRDRIKNKLLEIANTTDIINSSIEIQDLGRVEFLKVIEIKNKSEDIDRRVIHRLISKEVI